MAATRKPTQTPKPIAKKTTPKMPGMGPVAKVASKPKPKPAPGPKFNDKKIQDMLTGKTPVLLNGKKPKTAQELKEAIRIKTGVYPNTSR
jgi:hypothetical protein